jgi:hypothetical protein
MIRAIVAKELRENWGLVALALVLPGLYVCKQVGVLRTTWLLDWVPGLSEPRALLPFIQSGMGTSLGFAGFPLALALGFRQSCWDPSHGTMLYLLHLPVSRRGFFLTKLATGLALVLVSMGLPILAYGAWAAWPGTHPAPFEWSMSASALRTLALMPLVYLGAFASGIRPARWLGSRLLPLVGVVVPAVFIYFTSLGLGLALLGLLSVALVIDIVVEASERDF